MQRVGITFLTLYMNPTVQMDYSSMPWMAVPFSDRDRAHAIRKKLGVKEIPKVIMIDTGGKVINRQAFKNIIVDKDGSNFPWYEPVGATCWCW